MYTYKAIPLYVVDGDTFDFQVDLGFHTFTRIRVRLKDIDTPEVRGPERPQGLIVKDYVKSLFVQYMNNITIETTKTGSFGRWIADVKINGASLTNTIKEAFPEYMMEYKR